MSLARDFGGVATSGGRTLMEPLRILTGPTASGKSAVAICLARRAGAEIISVDSMKVYRGLDIGTAKTQTPSAVCGAVPIHMVDVVEAGEAYTLARYLEAAAAVVKAIAARGRAALFVGGTPLYLRGLVYGIFKGPGADWSLRERLMEKAREHGAAALHEDLRKVDPVTADRLHPNDLVRVVRALEVAHLTQQPLSAHQVQYPAPTPAVSYRMVALRRSEADLRERINRRTERMFAAGLVDEVRGLLDRGGLNRSIQKAIGYREVLAHLRGEFSLAETVEEVKRSTWRLARKQRAWLKSFPDIQGVDVPPQELPEETAARVSTLLFGPESRN